VKAESLRDQSDTHVFVCWCSSMTELHRGFHLLRGVSGGLRDAPPAMLLWLIVPEYHERGMLTEPLLRWADLSCALSDATLQPVPSDLLFPGSSKSPDRDLAGLVSQLNAAERWVFDMTTLGKAVDRLASFGIGWEEIDECCEVEFPNMFFARYHLIAALILLSGSHIGVHVGPRIVHEKLPELVYDEDGLLAEDTPRAALRKEGVLTRDCLLQYSHYLLDYNLALQGGFLESLADLSRGSSTWVHVAINPHIVLDSDYWSSICHRVYIRGPKAPSPERLADRWFPSTATGEVTEHRRLEENPVLELMLPLDKTQVMWTRKQERKTVQIEELVPVNSTRHTRCSLVLNRYLHSIWEMNETAFGHADGAIRAYSRDDYGVRQNSDLRGYSGKATAYKKLFRIDGAIRMQEWSDLTWKFFFGNELVIEYLESL